MIRLASAALPALLGVSAVFAQDPCTAGGLAGKPGALRASRLAGSTGGLAPADIARARATMTRVHQMIAAGYSPVGVVGDYSYQFSNGSTAATFGYSMYLLKYGCSRRGSGPPAVSVAAVTPTVLRIHANVIHAYDLSAADTSDNSFRGYMFMRSLPKKVDGVYFLGDDPGGATRENQKSYTWLVTYGDQLPFTVLTRREYLVAVQERLEKSIRESGNSSGFYKPYTDRVAEELRVSEAELSRPAIVNRLDEERFTGFLAEGTRGATYVIRHNPAYYRKGLPKSAAHFLTVVFSVDEADPVYAANIKAIRKALDLSSMRGLLGK